MLSKRIASGIVLILIFINMISLTFKIQPAKARPSWLVEGVYVLYEIDSPWGGNFKWEVGSITINTAKIRETYDFGAWGEYNTHDEVNVDTREITYSDYPFSDREGGKTACWIDPNVQLGQTVQIFRYYFSVSDMGSIETPQGMQEVWILTSPHLDLQECWYDKSTGVLLKMVTDEGTFLIEDTNILSGAIYPTFERVLVGEVSLYYTEGAEEITSGDFNNDGLQDLATVHRPGHVFIWYNKGKGVFEKFQIQGDVDGELQEICVGDFDGDETDDLAISDRFGETYIFYNRGNKVFEKVYVGDFADFVWEEEEGSGSYEEIKGLASGDFDNNDLADLAMVVGRGSAKQGIINKWYVLYNRVGNGFEIVKIRENMHAPDVQQITSADINDDGLTDIVACTVRSSYLILHNQGDRIFDTTNLSLGDEQMESLALGDLNADGLVDIVAVPVYNHVYIYYNLGDETFTEKMSIGNVGAYASGLTVEDLDGDGLLDVAACNAGYSGNQRSETYIFYNVPGHTNIYVHDRNGDDIFATLFVDDEWRGSGYFLSIQIPAGRHEIRAERTGYESAETVVSISSGETKDVTLEMVEWAAILECECVIKEVIAGFSSYSVDLSISNVGTAELEGVRLSSIGEIGSWVSFSSNNFNIPSLGSKEVTVTFSAPSYSDFRTGKIEIDSLNGGNKQIDVTLIAPDFKEKFERVANSLKRTSTISGMRVDEGYLIYYFKYKNDPIVMILFFDTYLHFTSATIFNVTSNTYVTNSEVTENLIIYQLALSSVYEDILRSGTLTPSHPMKKSRFFAMLLEDYIGNVNRLYSSFRQVHLLLAITSVLQSLLGDPSGLITQGNIVYELAVRDSEIEEEYPSVEFLSKMLKSTKIFIDIQKAATNLYPLFDDVEKAYDAIKVGKKIPESLSMISMVNVFNAIMSLISFGDWAAVDVSHAKAALAYAAMAEHAAALSNYYALLENGNGDELCVKMAYLEECVIRSLQKKIYETYKEVLESNKYNLLFWIGVELAKWVTGGDLPDFDLLIKQEEEALETLNKIYNNLIETASRLTQNYRIPRETKRFEVYTLAETYDILVTANSTIDQFDFDSSLQQVSLTVTGPSGVVGFCNVTIPKSLLYTSHDRWEVLIDEEPVTPTITENATHTFIYLTYTTSTRTVKIKALPYAYIDYGLYIVGVVIATPAIITVAILVKRRKKQSNSAELPEEKIDSVKRLFIPATP